MHSPIEQFGIQNLSSPLFTIAGHPVAFTNSTLFMFVAVFLASSFMFFGIRKRAVVPGRFQALTETLYNGIAGTLSEAAGEKAKPFLPFIFSVFLYISFCNLIGMFPHVFTVTSHIIVNLVLAFLVIMVVVVTGFVKHGMHFLKIFAPSGVPPILVPFLSLIEFVSFWVRPFSLSLRLFANMLAGHILLKVFAGMAASLGEIGGGLVSVGILPMIVDVVIVAFEFFVALLQAYVFTVLSSVYLRDALEMH